MPRTNLPKSRMFSKYGILTILAFSLLSLFLVNNGVAATGPTKTLYIHNYNGPDIGYKIGLANQDCGSVLCEIKVDQLGTIATTVTLSDNRIVTFNQGNYIIKASIVLGNNNEIRGSGLTLTTFTRDPTFFKGLGSDLRTSPPGNFNDIRNAEIIRSQAKTGLKIHDFTIEGSTTAIGWYSLISPLTKTTYHQPKGLQEEIKIIDGKNFVLDNVRILNVQKTTLAVLGVNGITIRNSEFASNGWNAGQSQLLHFGAHNGRYNTNLVMDGNYIHDSSHGALFLDYVNGATITNNNFDHNRLNTYYSGPGGQINVLPLSHGINFTANTIKNSGLTIIGGRAYNGAGIEDHGYNVTITRNTITNNTSYAVIVKNNDEFGGKYPPAHDASIVNNIIANNGLKVGMAQIHQEPGVYNITISGNKQS